MGKKGRKTRWRTLTITDEHSDSEESNTTTSGHRVSKPYPQKSFYNRFTYSSQSTPTRRYQCDGTKSTRSSSTASENKITFNEDEYTRITTPRQDVLFKKGYLNKPKTYQTQTSTGNSTTSTGNSTGNGTPDHQSTDLEYESQFVFPNGFVDQNGIYYVNSFEPYPLMVFNPPTYYPEFSSIKSKRCSTGSLTESTSPNNEETSQDLSQSETPSNVSDFNHVYNVIYPGFYFNGACQPQDVANHQPEPRRMKKRRRKKPSRPASVQEATTSEYTDESSSDEVFSDHQEKAEQLSEEAQETDPQEPLTNGLSKEDSTESPPEEDEEETKEEEIEEQEEKAEENVKKYDLKPDAEEFVPRAYRHPETIPMEPSIQFIKIPSNFVPLPILNPIGDFNGQTFNAFIPPGIPINFIPQNYINFIPSYPTKTDNNVQAEKKSERVEEEVRETVEVPKNQIDIAKIVSKLEEAAKEQDDEVTSKEEDKRETSPKPFSRKLNGSGRILKRNRYQKVENEEAPKTAWKQPSSPKKEIPQTPPTPKLRNYSETLKKPQVAVAQQCDKNDKHNDKQKLAKTIAKEVVAKNHARAETPPPKMPNQWISVSNRKKRKNKNVEETEDFEEKEETAEKLVEEEIVTVTVSEESALLPPPSLLSLPPKEEVIVEEVVSIKVEEPTIEIKEEIKEEKKDKIKSIPKKKSKKNGNQKLVTKRVIITDVDLSQEVEKVNKEETVETVEVKVEEVVEEEEIKPEIVEEKIEEPVEEVVEDKKETPEKKSKKKKKKVLKPTLLHNSSPSLNVMDDSYDFLLETSVLKQSQEKTNVEISQELDKMIQRGMYSSLEEKMKSLNIESSDTFFKSFMTNISSNESSVEKKNFGKNADIDKLLNNPALLKAKPAAINPKMGDFLGESTPRATSSGGDEAESKREDLYPITKAVREWVTKTRETTPDVEIFKSPSTILKEFGVEELEEELLNGDDVSVYSFSREGSVEVGSEDDVAPKKTTSFAEESEEAIEEYESKYGKNEDYLLIKKEVEEKTGGNYPKHGNLPYRAICCSIM